MSVIVDVILFFVAINLLMVLCGVAIIKDRMTRNESLLRRNGIYPAGSRVRHGMVRRPEGTGVDPDSGPTLQWYVDLATRETR